MIQLSIARCPNCGRAHSYMVGEVLRCKSCRTEIPIATLAPALEAAPCFCGAAKIGHRCELGDGAAVLHAAGSCRRVG